MEHVSPHAVLGGPGSVAASASSPTPSVMEIDGLVYQSSHLLNVTKPVKKRKSWGQELPEPKTSLAPRKRAKTDDEKEQRRIERIKRNRAAAHNSRERKRQEAEDLAKMNDVLVQKIKNLERTIKSHKVVLDKCKEQLGSAFPESESIIEEEDIVEQLQMSMQQQEEYDDCDTPESSSTIDPRRNNAYSTPATSTNVSPVVKLEDNICDAVTTEVAPLFGPLDLTQHSAAMLCDLQCYGYDDITRMAYGQTPDFSPDYHADESVFQRYDQPVENFDNFFDFDSLTSPTEPLFSK